MELRVVAGDITVQVADAIVVNLFEGVERPGGATAAVDQALGGAITQLMAAGEIKGKLNEVTIIHTLGKMEAQRVVVAGLGKQAEFTLDRVRGVSAEVGKALRRVGVGRVATITHGAGVGGLSPESAAQAVAEGALLGLYRFVKYKSKGAEDKELKELVIVERDGARVPELERGVARGRVLAEATMLTRDLVNEPANAKTPAQLAEEAMRLAQASGLECTVLDRDEMGRLGMGALLGVAQGSRQPPKFIILRYWGAGRSPEPAEGQGKSALGLVGKGITFDSGGISIKPAEGMGEMKGDMAGGASVMATLRALAQLEARVNVTGLIPATENMPGGAALKPGDVLKAMSGKTIEVVTTDAEGRLILADALSYARKLGLSPLVDVATLTGACRIALGNICTGVFGNNQGLIDRIVKAGEAAGERMWPMPMYEEYKEQNKSDVADIQNSGGRYGGAITAAQFLAEFSEDTPWVHLDIAGTSMADKERTYTVKGATGVPVRTLTNLALGLAKNYTGEA